MKIGTPQQLDIQNVSGDFQSIEAGMDTSSLPFILEMLSKNFYSNPIGSICREITSNCFDSHIEAGVDEPVIIEMNYDEEGDYISFKDVGVGLSTERIQKVYMKYFTSTKRDTNELIGGFGLGSKTPLAYQDYFYITTIFDKKKYSYLFSKGATLPTLDLLSEEDTEDHNGTEVKIYIKNLSDKNRFVDELRSQLSYFDNVYFIGCNIDNEYQIYETDLFKYRNKDQYSDEMHICFGKVSYPIDWNQINMNTVRVPVGIKFNIDELVVTPNREALRYTDEVKSILIKRIVQTVEELKSLYIAQQVVYTDFFAWHEGKTTRKYLNFGTEGDRVELIEFNDLGTKHELQILNELGFDKSILEDDIFNKIYNRDYQLSGGKIVKYGSMRNLTDFLINNRRYCLLSEDTNFSGIKNFYHKNGIILQKRSLKYIINDIKNRPHQGVVKNAFKPKEIKAREEKIRRSNAYVTEEEASNWSSNYFDLGLSVKLYKLVKYLQDQVESQVRKYHIKVDDDLKRQYREYQEQFDLSKKRKLEGKVYIRSISENSDYDWKLQEIEEYKGLVIYGFLDDRRDLEKAVAFCYLRKTLRKYYDGEDDETGEINKQACRIIRISQSNEKHFKNKSNMVYVKNLYGDNKLFRQLASSYRIELLLGDYLKNYTGTNTEGFIDFLKTINQSVGETFEELRAYHKSFTSDTNIYRTKYDRSDLKQEIIQIAEKFNLFDPNIESKIKIIEDYFSGVELLKHVDFNEDTLPVILKYLRDKKKRINLEYYCKIVENGGGQLIIDFEPKEPVTKFQLITEAA